MLQHPNHIAYTMGSILTLTFWDNVLYSGQTNNISNKHRANKGIYPLTIGGPLNGIKYKR
jgi:hypothetical protein